MGNLLEKLKGFGEESMVLKNSTQAKLKAGGADEMVTNLQEKLKQQFLQLENMASFSIGWLGEVVLPGLRNGSMIGNLQQKLKWIGEGSMVLMNSTQAKLKAVGADEMVANLQEKLKQQFLQLENMAWFSVGWLGEIVLPGLRNGSMISNLQQKLKWIGEESMVLMNRTLTKLKAAGVDEMMNNLQGKLKQQFLMPLNSGLFLAGWFDKIFPPEIRKEILHRLHIGAMVVAAGLVLLVLLLCVIRCAGSIGLCIAYIFRFIGVCIVYFFRFIGLCISYFFRCIGTCCGITMMRAPGLGLWIPRCLFEACPRAYFCALRAITALASALASVGGSR